MVLGFVLHCPFSICHSPRTHEALRNDRDEDKKKRKGTLDPPFPACVSADELPDSSAVT